MQRVNNALSASLLAVAIAVISLNAHAEIRIVEMLKYKFVPEEITIKVGDTVRWVNTERRQYHTIWLKAQGEKETAELFPTETFEKTFNEPGDYPYLCGPHWEQRDMIGVVHVIP
jgi:plastocyanin